MFTIDLEKKLVEEKQNTLDDSDGLVQIARKILESENAKDLAMLKKSGFSTEYYSDIVQKADRNSNGLKSDRVFTKDEIRQICLDYNLRHLNVKYYNGHRPPELAQKLREFENELYTNTGSNPLGGELQADRVTIAAPESSFKLEERPKDPLLFYQLDNGMYYLVHKWGNDLSIWNKIVGNFKSNEMTHCINYMLLILGFSMFAIPNESESVLLFLNSIAFVACGGVLVMGFYRSLLNSVRDYKRSWDSNFSD